MQLDVWHDRNRQNMGPGRDEVVVAATLDNVRDGLAIDLEIGGKVPAEIRRSDHNQTSPRLTGSFGKRESGNEDKDKNKSADAAG